MQINSSWELTKEDKDRLIDAMTPELLVLRTKAGVSQEELAELIGISRQTYGAIERGTKQMSWATFLSLVLFFDCNHKTHSLLRQIKAIPQVLSKRFNGGNEFTEVQIDSFLGEGYDSIINNLDDQAKQSIRTMILLEYARCTSTPGDVIVKSFDGMAFSAPPVIADVEAKKALNAIKGRQSSHE